MEAAWVGARSYANAANEIVQYPNSKLEITNLAKQQKSLDYAPKRDFSSFARCSSSRAIA